MKHLRIQMQRYGAPEVLEPVEGPLPEPGPGEVLVRAAVSGVNRADLFIRSGEWPIRGPFPYVPGLEVAGTVDRVGQGVTDLAEGDAVITMMQRLGGIHGERPGGYQSHVLVPAASLARVPTGLTPLDVGVLGLPAVTAVLALRALDFRAGHRVLVHGGSSAVGSIALQLVAAGGATAIASGTRPAKFDFMRRCGAQEVVDTTDPGWPKSVGELDRVLDLVGQATFADSVGLLKAGGRLVFTGGTSGGALAFSGWDLMKPVTLTGYSSEALTQGELSSVMAKLAALWTRGALRVAQVTEFPLRDAAEAHRRIEAGELAGRVVLRP